MSSVIEVVVESKGIDPDLVRWKGREQGPIMFSVNPTSATIVYVVVEGRTEKLAADNLP